MKKIMRKVLCLSAAFLLAVTLATPAMASREVEVLFSEDLHPGEHLIRRVEHDGVYHHPRDRYSYTDWTHVTRPVLGYLTVDEDVVIGDLVRVEVPEGAKLTVASGSTLTIHGELLVAGELVNRGTIIIGNRSAYREEDEIDPYYKSLIINDNGGHVANYGDIKIIRGEFQNRGEALFQNDGTVDITNRDEDLAGIVNYIIMRTTAQPGIIINNGTINVKNTAGYGIRSDRNAILENTGEITYNEEDNIAANIVGTQAVRFAPPPLEGPVELGEVIYD